MAVKTYNWEDPQIREMVERNHVPGEVWYHSAGGSQLTGIFCEECNQDWPCSTVLALKNRPQPPVIPSVIDL